MHYSASTLRPRQDCRNFPDDIFRCIFLNENTWIAIDISLSFVPKGPIDNIPAVAQIMAWRRSGASHYLNQWWLVYRRIYASLGHHELTRVAIDIAVITASHIREINIVPVVVTIASGMTLMTIKLFTVILVRRFLRQIMANYTWYEYWDTRVKWPFSYPWFRLN